MEQALQIASWVCISLGCFFILVGAIGLIRMPDIFTRMHAAGIKDTMGAGFLLLGLVLAEAQRAGFTLVTVKLFIVYGLFLFISPVISHALAQAALHDGEKPLLGKDKKKAE